MKNLSNIEVSLTAGGLNITTPTNSPMFANCECNKNSINFGYYDQEAVISFANDETNTIIEKACIALNATQGNSCIFSIGSFKLSDSTSSKE